MSTDTCSLRQIRVGVTNRVAGEPNNNAMVTSPCGVVVSASQYGSGGLGFESYQVMWDFSALAGSYSELGVLWAQWEDWNHTAELHPLHGCVFEQVPQFAGLVNTGIIMTVSVFCDPVK